jgi:putative transposase
MKQTCRDTNHQLNTSIIKRQRWNTVTVSLPEEVAERLEHHPDVHRQLYNHIRRDYEQAPEDHNPSEYDQNNKLPEWKRKWPVFSELHSKATQATVARFHRNLSNPHNNKKRYNVSRLTRQAPADYRSVTYKQSGFDLNERRGSDRFAYVRFGKIGWVNRLGVTEACQWTPEPNSTGM